MKKGLRRRAAKGKLVGGPRPYGYRWVGPKGEKVLEEVPAEASVVRRIFEDAVNGVSQRALARQLNQDGIPPVAAEAWGQASVGRILANPVYMGMVRHAGEVFPGAHEAIVTEALWDQAAAIRASQARRKGGRWPKGSHLFTGGLLRCRCGSAMLPRTDPQRRGGKYQVYVCGGRGQHGIDYCAQPVIDRAVIDEAILDELGRRYLDVDETRRRLEAKLASDAAIAAAASTEAEADAQRARARIDWVQRALQDGFLDPADYAQQRAQLIERRPPRQPPSNVHWRTLTPWLPPDRWRMRRRPCCATWPTCGRR